MAPFLILQEFHSFAPCLSCQRCPEFAAQTNGLSTNEVEPLPLEFYLRYAQWFQEQKQLAVLPALVRKLDWNEGQAFPFYAIMDNGESVAARFVVLAVGLQYFKNVPSDLVKILPEGRYSHTCDLVEFEAIAGKRCLIIGGRQGAFEWAALMCETGVDPIHLCYRHDSPEFTPSDWSWMDPSVVWPLLWNYDRGACVSKVDWPIHCC